MILEMIFSVLFHTLFTFYFFTFVESVPEDYCLSPLNTSDCGRPPTPVFYYYKPGSRCEIKLWRGCPTANLFNTEYHCSHHCIGKLGSSEQDVKAGTLSKAPLVDAMTDLNHKCELPIDTSQCTQEEQLVYTYDNEKNKCIKVTYYGCPTENKFKDEKECQDICKTSKDQWENAMNKIDLDELNEINKALDEVNDEIEAEKEDLKKDIKNSKIVPHTISDIDEVTDLPGEETNEVDNESKETTENPEKHTQTESVTDEPVAPTDNTEITTKEEERETEAETIPVVTTTNTVLQEEETVAEETTILPVSTKRRRKTRPTKKRVEGDIVRVGIDSSHQ